LLARVKINLKIRKLQKQLETQNQLLKQEISRSQKLDEARQKVNLLLEQTVQSRTKTLSASPELEQCRKALKTRNNQFDTVAQKVGNLKNALNTIVRTEYGGVMRVV
jgi:multidrug resistance efflux pump